MGDARGTSQRGIVAAARGGYLGAMEPARRVARDVPPLWLLVALLLQLGLHTMAPGGRWLAPPWTHWGWLGIVGGVALTGGSVRRFLRAGTGLRPFMPATTLVVNGAYRWTRNPMYVGLLLVTVGAAVCFGTWSPAGVPPLFLLFLDRRFVAGEEAFLRARFGQDFDAYCRRVRRWL